ncbi:MAG TPA: aldolase/citrate lyase family protein [Actinomycetota bacterium]
MPTDRLRETWARDEPVFNAWLVLDGAAAASVVAAAGFDTVTLDLQHGASSLEEAAHVVAGVEPHATPLARPRWNDPGEIMRLLDVGARGIVCPMVGSPAEAERLVAACRYPPAGARSYGPVRGAFGAGADHVRLGEAETLVFAMIETAEGLKNVDDIAATPGVDGLYVGPADLSLALGLSSFADFEDAALLEALDAVVHAGRRHGIVPGVHAPSPERSARMVERGFRFVSPAVDADLLGSSGTAALAATRSLLEQD